jgi:quinol monooxygenase YgiN
VIYTTGVWTVRQGSDEEFVRVWRDMAQGMADEFAVVPRLMRDVEHPRLFFTIAGPWRDTEQVSEALASPRFAGARTALRDHLESIAISTYELVAEVQ